MERDKRLQLLENKVAELQQIIQGNELSDKETVQSVMKSLKEANTMMISILSSREKLKSLFDNASRIESLADPTSCEQWNDEIKGKLATVLHSEQDIAVFMKAVSQLYELQKVIDSPVFASINNDKQKVETLKINSAANYGDCEKISKRVNELAAVYENAMTSISSEFLKIDKILSSMEQTEEASK